jgi:uncharacterized protein (DUF1501 family)
MSSHSTFVPSRRDFLRRSGQLALSGTALPFALNLAAMGEAAALTATAGDPNDYKALVCVFLYGGNDYANTLVTYDDASYDQYSTIRGGGALRTAGGIAFAQSALAATELKPAALDVPVDSLGVARKFALNPTMTGLTNLFNTGKMAVQLNVGPLVKPLTRAQYNSSDKVANPRPPQLFSHNDQQSVWQSSSPEGSTIGWGGNIGDLALAPNPVLNTPAQFTCISVTGNAVFLSGDTALQYQVSTGGAIKISAAVSGATIYGSSTAASGAMTVSAAMRTILQQTGSHKLENEYNKVTTRAIAAETKVTDALKLTDATATPTAGVPLATVFPTGNSLADQLKMVARLIKGRTVLGAQRQVFMVSIGGFDLHDNLIRDHGGTLGKVSAAMTAFYDATVEMGVATKVTAFTASDFGRTLASNGDGSDHGWGSHHFVVGGAVNGKKFYGTAPPISVADTKDSGGNYLPANQWHVGQGRLLPSTSVDQYAATLAKWFGVTITEMPTVLPKIVNFGNLASPARLDYPVDLGFMA